MSLTVGGKKIGRVSRGAAGGSSLGDTTGLSPTGKKIGGKHVYGQPKAPPTTVQTMGLVPNTSTNQGPVYTPPPSAPLASFEPNTSTPAGPVYTPPPAQTPPASFEPTAAGGGSSPVSPGTGSAGSASSSGAPSTPLRQVTLTDDNGVQQAYEYDPNFSFISQTGRYQYDFWTKEGQKERLKNALEVSGFGTTGVQFSGGESDPTSLPGAKATINVLNAAAILYGAAGAFNSLANAGKLGQLAATPGGVQTIAGSTKTAATAANVGKTIAGVPKNPGTIANTINGIKALLTGNKLITVGVVLGTLKMTGSQIESVNKDKTDFTKESRALQQKLLDAGMYDMARELYETNKDIRTGFDQILPYIPIFGDTAAKKQILEGRDQLYEAELAFEKFEKKAIEQAKAEAEAQDAADQATADQQAADQNAIDNKLAQDKFDYQKQQDALDRKDRQTQGNAAADAQAGADATALEDQGGSTLGFGLLGTGGATQFVDKDKAARFYYSKPYEELTAAQKALLNLLKQGQQT